MTGKEMDRLGWDSCDVVLISGDAYVDHPSFASAIVGRHLESLGYRVGIIAQPNISKEEDFLELGIPKLFVGITSGAMDSMVNHYTSLNRIRSNDAYSPGGRTGLRPDRALLKYVNGIQRFMPGVPVVIGGIEASMRRFSHYDYWSDKVRKSILLDSKADILVYGMGEQAVEEIADSFSRDEFPSGVRGTVIYSGWKSMKGKIPEECIELPSHETVVSNPEAFMDMTRIIERESNPWCAYPLLQRADNRAVLSYPPSIPLSTKKLDKLYELPFAREPHPSYQQEIPAFTMIRNSVTAVRGCSGGCSFCALGLHQGRMITSRSRDSVIREIVRITEKDYFRGTITDIGGPTANLYGLGCRGGERMKKCRRVSCLHPDICDNFETDHSEYVKLLKAAEEVDGVNNVFVSSGIRFDVALKDESFLQQLVSRNVSGLLKIAPEHFTPEVLELMRKPPPELWRRFREAFLRISEKCGKEQYIEPYLMAAFPGCDAEDMKSAAEELRKQGMNPRKAQVFLPTPMTMATAIYFTGIDPVSGRSLRVERKPSQKKKQLRLLPGHSMKK